MEIGERRSTKRDWYWLAALIAIEIGIAGWLIAAHRLPDNHDAFQFFSLQYVLLNNAISSGEVAQWMPYMTHGTVANWWYSIQGGVVQNVALIIAPLIPRGTDLLPIFHLGMLVESLILLIGMWLLCRRLGYTTPATVLVCAATMNATLWIDQPWFNFKILYAIPMLVYLGHRFIDRPSPWLLLGGTSLFVVSLIGSLPYFAPVISLVVFLYLGCYTAFNFAEVRPAVRTVIRHWWVYLPVVIVCGLMCVPVFYVLSTGTDELVRFIPGREQDGSSTLKSFLEYGGHLTLAKWSQCFLGIPLSRDYTVYSGVLCATLALASLCGIRRRWAHVLCVAVLLVLLSSGSQFAALTYYVWPGMKYFRHLGLLAPTANLFILLLAGRGFTALLEHAPQRKELELLRLTLIVCLAAWCYGIIHSDARHLVWNAISHASRIPMSTSPAMQEDAFGPRRFLITGIVTGVIAALLGAQFRWRTARCLVVMFVVVGIVDSLAYRLDYTINRLRPLPEDSKLFVTQDVPYQPRRVVREKLTGERAEALKAWTRGQGGVYWTNYVFASTDQSGHIGRTDHWLWPIDRLMRAMDLQNPLDHRLPPRGFSYHDFWKFPTETRARRRVIGCDEDKIQFYRNAYAIASEARAGELLNGDGALCLLANEGYGTDDVLPAPTTDDSVHLPYKIERFDDNNLTVSFDNPDHVARWMVYCDAWHPKWTVTVNETPQQIRRANIGYKAVELAPGTNVVHFRFYDWRYAACAWYFAALSVVVIVVIPYELRRAMRHSAPSFDS